MSPAAEATLAPGAAAPDLSVITPVFRNAASLEALCDEIEATLRAAGLRYELIAVCDASPDDSWDVLRTLSTTRPWLKGVLLARNQGQHRAIWQGLLLASGSRLAVLGADLQDPPAALPALLAELDRADADVVFARHVGAYQQAGRLVTSWGFKRLRARLAGVPDGSSLNLVMRREVLADLQDYYAPTPFLVSMLGLRRRRCVAVDVTRSSRPYGRSAYSSLGRLALASRELAWILLWKALPSLRRRPGTSSRAKASTMTQTLGFQNEQPART